MKVVFIVFAVLGSLVGGLYVGRDYLKDSSAFRITNVTLVGTEKTSSSEILRVAELENNPNALEILPGEVAAKIERLPWVKSAQVSYENFPHKLLVEVEEEKPWMVVMFRGSRWLLSSTHKLIIPFSEVPEEFSDLPSLSGVSEDETSFSLTAARGRLEYALRQINLIDAAGGLPFKAGEFILGDKGTLTIVPAEKAFSIGRVEIKVGDLFEAERRLVQLSTVIRDLAGRGEQANRVRLVFADRAVID